MLYFIYICNLVLIALIVYTLYVKSKNFELFAIYFPALGLKLLAGIGLGLVFRHHYGLGDTLRYFEEAERYADLARQDVWLFLKEIFNDSATPFKSIYHNQPRALLMSKITGFFAILTGKNYWLTSVYFSFFSFLGFWLLAERLSRIFKNKLAIIISLFLFPSVVFWTSGISKESLSMGLLALILWAFLGYAYGHRKFKIQHLLIECLALFLLWQIKYYYAGVLILVLVAATITWMVAARVEKFKNTWYLQFLTFVVCCLVMSLLVSFTHPNFNLERVGDVIVKNHDAFVAKSEPGEVMRFNNLSGDWKSLLYNTPLAMISGLFRPWPTDGTGILSFFAKGENLILMLLTVTSFAGISKKLNYKHRILVFSTICYCLILATFLALFTPNFGTLVRYKIGFLPFLLLLVTMANPVIKSINQRLFSE